jgi:rhombotail lipoprotein
MKISIFKFILIGLVVIVIQGCGTLGPRSSSSKDLGSVLEPVKDSIVAKEKKPLIFPATVSVLMVPGNNHRMVPNSTLRLAAEELKKGLLKNAKYINGVSIISTDDIRGKIALNTIRDLYGTDIVVVLSYEQDQRRLQNGFFAFLDMLIIPVFIFPGVEVTTSTVVDGKIIHIPSNAIIFRSSGTDERSTYLSRYSSEGTKADEESIDGFTSAINKFGESVGIKLSQLDKFDMSQAVSMNKFIEGQAGSQRKQSSPGDNWARVDTYKGSGGGAFGFLEVFLLICMAVFWITRVWRVKEPLIKSEVPAAQGSAVL